MQSGIFSIITSSVSHDPTMLIWCSRNVSYYQ